jgi:hypothetical protein
MVIKGNLFKIFFKEKTTNILKEILVIIRKGIKGSSF